MRKHATLFVRDKEKLDLCGISTLFPRSTRLCSKKNCQYFKKGAPPFVEERVQKFQGLLHSWSSVLLYEIRLSCTAEEKRKLSYLKIRSALGKFPTMNLTLRIMNYLTKELRNQQQIYHVCQFDIHMSVHRKYISKLHPTRFNVFLIYLFLQTLYMFQAVPPPIIRSTKTVHAASGIVNQYCCLLLSWMRWN